MPAALRYNWAAVPSFRTTTRSDTVLVGLREQFLVRTFPACAGDVCRHVWALNDCMSRRPRGSDHYTGSRMPDLENKFLARSRTPQIRLDRAGQLEVNSILLYQRSHACVWNCGFESVFDIRSRKRPGSMLSPCRGTRGAPHHEHNMAATSSVVRIVLSPTSQDFRFPLASRGGRARGELSQRCCFHRLAMPVYSWQSPPCNYPCPSAGSPSRCSLRGLCRHAPSR